MDDTVAAAVHLLDETSDEELLEDILLYKRFHKEPQKTYTRSFKLDNVAVSDCWQNFRFTKEDIPRLAEALQLPLVFETPNRLKIDRLEALCILLRRLAYPCRLCDVGFYFGRHFADISTIFNVVLNHIYDAHSGRLASPRHPWLDLGAMSQKVRQKGSPLPHCFGFIDGTVRPIARPSRNQREVYSGHKRVQALKFQAVTLPSGIIAHMYGPMVGRRHDSALLGASGLMPEMEQNAQGYYIYGDQAYPVRQQLQSPFRGAVLTPEQELFNKEMGKLRLCVEWSFGKIIQLFAFLDFKKNQKLLLQPIAKHYIVDALLTNCHTCLYGSVTTSYFDCSPPTLEEYLYM